ncbi:apolipoprotein N-acyltransferase [uncultured Cohaesibacter sp.]|uniref:apolipoprotein N-acyltransferase n=1 Tax=uncultured Cohaesibacter sp. TaxID=1002546 RepID=UPI00292D370A|nr:apolipoprotein N-acyltransferase [uncultured Cohaesibacter sp.]
MALFISNLILLDGWRRYALGFACGAISSLAQAPVGWFPILWVTFPVLVWLLDSAALGKSRKQALYSMARVGWVFGFGFFAFTFYWLGSAFFVEADKFAWLSPVAVLLFPAGLALFWGAATALVAPVWRPGPVRVLLLALSWSLFEWLRGVIFTGLPWGGLGPALASNGVTMQILSITGPDSLNLLAPLIFSIPVLVFAQNRQSRHVGMAIVIGLVFLAQLGFGLFRLNQPAPVQDHPIVVRLIQPNIAQKEKWKLENRSWIFNRLLALTTVDDQDSPLSAVDLFVWPETAVPFYLIEQPTGLAVIARALPDDATLLTGALRRETDLEDKHAVYNSIYQLAGDGTIMNAYDKIHLVPFGEYLPKEIWLNAIGLEKLTSKSSDFSFGSKQMLLGNDGLGKILPLICYEVAFSGDVLSFPKGADMIVNVTNDAWFGNSIGPWQHLHLARMRAVETGLPLLRAANTGISAIIDAKGRIVQSLSLEKDGIIQSPLPVKLRSTLYVQLGNWIFVALWLLLCLITLITRRKIARDALY